jgi:hypothetical protein
MKPTSDQPRGARCVRDLFRYDPGISAVSEMNLFVVQKRLEKILDFDYGFSPERPIWSSPKRVRRIYEEWHMEQLKPLEDFWNVGFELNTGTLVQLGFNCNYEDVEEVPYIPQSFVTEPAVPRIGIYDPEQRKARIQRFLRHRKKRISAQNKIRYMKRKNSSNSRCRVKGRFAKINDQDTVMDGGRSDNVSSDEFDLDDVMKDSPTCIKDEFATSEVSIPMPMPSDENGRGIGSSHQGQVGFSTSRGPRAMTQVSSASSYGAMTQVK